ncbi:hypothetical protein JNJ66_06100 [Candidatus Saccharibacteria bacterium]|nr:hypothetical protein [Candidatus Saccharibacteria bacterium]
MTTEPLNLLVGALGGAVVTSILGPYLMQSKDRRTARAKALNAMLEVEANRWHPVGYDTFKLKVIKLRAAALIATTDRELVESYIYISAVAHNYSCSPDNEFNDDEHSGGIPVELAAAAREAGEHLTKVLWYPVRTAPLLFYLKRKLNRRLAATRNALKDDNIVTWGVKV